MDDNLKNLEVLLAAMSKDHLGRQEFTDAFKKVIDIIVAFKKEATMVLKEIQRANLEAIGKLSSDSSIVIGDMRKQTDGMFVQERVNKVLKDHSDKMLSLDEKLKLVDDKIMEADLKLGQVRNGQDGKNADPVLVADMVHSRIKEEMKLIEKLEDLIKDVERLKNRPVAITGTTGRDLFKDKDISTNFDGVTKTFGIGAFYSIISVSLSSYPYGTLRKDIDFTYDASAGTITFTDLIDAGTQLAAGQQCVITIVVN